MGFAIAEAARKRGAAVTIVAGVTSAVAPESTQLIRADSAEQMQDAVLKELPTASVFIGAAAVADYRPASPGSQKIKKTESSISLELERTPDILSSVAKKRHDGLLVIGFAAETEKILENASEKLTRKNLDAIIANDVSRSGAGFDSDTNEVTILSRDRKTPIHVPLMSKTNVANIILDEVVRLRARAKSTAESKQFKRKSD